MMSASRGTEIASMRAAVGEKIVGRQRNADGRTAFQLYIPYRRKFSRDEIFTNFASKIAFVKI